MTTFMTYKEECEALRQRVAELEARLERINPLLDEAADKIDALEKKRDELLAYAEQLREALETLNKVSNIGCDLVYEALALPRPTSALDAYVEQKLKEK